MAPKITDSPISKRTPVSVAQAPNSCVAATITILFRSGWREFHCGVFPEDGETEEQAFIRARRKLAEAISNAIINDDWSEK